MSDRLKPIDHHDNTVFTRRYDELAPLFLDYDKARLIFKGIVDPSQRCLEVGIGSGLFSLPLIAEGYSIDGIEPNEAMVRALVTNAENLKIKPPRVEVASVVDYPFNTTHDVIFSHSGPFFITREGQKLFYEGLRIDGTKDDEAKGNFAILERILKSVQVNRGKLLLNIQENKSGVPLSDGSTFHLTTVGNGYDVQNLEVTKEYKFVESNGSVLDHGGQGTYRRFACSFDQFLQLISRVGEFDIALHGDIFLSVSVKRDGNEDSV